MNIRTKKKVKKRNNLVALRDDCKAVEKVSKFGSFILAYTLARKVGYDLDEKIVKLYKGLINGYKIPKGYSLVFRNRTKSKKVIEGNVINLKAFNREVFSKYKEL